MSTYDPISIREALRQINASPGGWFLSVSLNCDISYLH